MCAIAGDYPLDPSIIFPDDERPEFIDIDRHTFKGILQRADPDMLVDCAGETFPFTDDRVVFLALDKVVTAFRAPSGAGREGRHGRRRVPLLH